MHVMLDSPERLQSLKPLFLYRDAEGGFENVGLVSVTKVRRHRKGFVGYLPGFNNRDDAECLKGCEIRMLSQDFPKAEPGEFYWRDLIGLRVWCQFEGKKILLGEVVRLVETGSNDVLVVAPCLQSVDDKEHLVPWIPDEVIKEIDLPSKRIEVDWYIDA